MPILPPVPPSDAGFPVLRVSRVRRIMKADGLVDQWHLAERGGFSVFPMTLEVAAARARLAAEGNPILVHLSQIDVPDPAFFVLDLRGDALARVQEREASLWKDIWLSIVAQVLGLALVFGVISGTVWFRLRSLNDDMRVTETLLDRLRAAAPRAEEVANSRLPRLRLVLARTNYLLLVTNQSDQPWPTLTIEINGPDGYVYQFSDQVSSQRTLTLQLRAFVQRSGRVFSAGREELRSVTISVPGFQSMEQDFGEVYRL